MDLRPATFPSYILTILLILLVDACSCRNYKLRSRLQFSAGEGYSNILVGIDQNVADGDCPRIIEQVQVSQNSQKYAQIIISIKHVSRAYSQKLLLSCFLPPMEQLIFPRFKFYYLEVVACPLTLLA